MPRWNPKTEEYEPIEPYTLDTHHYEIQEAFRTQLLNEIRRLTQTLYDTAERINRK